MCITGMAECKQPESLFDVTALTSRIFEYGPQKMPTHADIDNMARCFRHRNRLSNFPQWYNEK